jgi:hypothetical protein
LWKTSWLLHDSITDQIRSKKLSKHISLGPRETAIVTGIYFASDSIEELFTTTMAKNRILIQSSHNLCLPHANDTSLILEAWARTLDVIERDICEITNNHGEPL